jgi:hypothetical protein
MTNYKHLGQVVEARQEYTEQELANIALNNLNNAHVGKTVLPLDDIEVNAKNVEAYAETLKIRTV